MEIPQPTNSNYFGIVNKVRWYQVVDYYNEYTVNLEIVTNQTTPTTISIQNRATANGTEWSETVGPTVTQQQVSRQAKILHIPNLKAVEYVVINQGT